MHSKNSGSPLTSRRTDKGKNDKSAVESISWRIQRSKK